jgi:formyl-CoA transferase
MPIANASSALTRFTVLDLTRVRAGPTAVRQLADWGANVIKIELPEHLDAPEGLGGARHGPDFQNLHRNKRSMTLDLKSPAGAASFRRLAAKADVVVENFRPDVKTRLGIDYAALSRINPRLIYASISGFGQTGPYRDRPGFDQIAQGLGGLMSITGEPGRGPMRVGIPVADLSAGLFCAQGILVALLEREQSGKGQEVATSLLQAQIFMLDFQASRWLNAGEVPAQAGNNHPTSVPTGVFKTRDGYINIATAGGEMWERLCKALDAPGLLANPQFATGRARLENRDVLNAAIDAHLAHRTSADSTPPRCCPSSASLPPRLPPCVRRRSFDILTRRPLPSPLRHTPPYSTTRNAEVEGCGRVQRWARHHMADRGRGGFACASPATAYCASFPTAALASRRLP